MKISDDVEIIEVPEYGVILKYANLDLACQFEDFLAEGCFVLFNVKLENSVTSFFFGQASNPVNVNDLYNRFIQRGRALP
jgi:hypothetical protein